MITGIVAFVAGVLLLQHQPALPSTVWLTLCPLLLLLAWRVSRLRPAACFALGFLWALGHAQWQMSDALAPALAGEDVLLEGHIATLPEQDGRRVRFEFQVDRLDYQGVRYPAPPRVRLDWYRDAPALIAGDYWRLRVRLKRPHGFMNPGGFDYEGWLFQRRIRATGYVRADPNNQRLGAGGARFMLLRWRQDLRERLNGVVADRRLSGLLSALIIGDRSDIDRSDWALFTRTGTNHLIAISGLHIGIVAGLVFFLVRRLWSRWPALVRFLPAPQAAAVAALGGAVGYAALAGFAVPTQRALLMLLALMGALLLRRQQRPSRGMALALLLVVMLDPFAVLSSGFWLSFAAVGIILYGMSGRLRARGFWWQWGRVQWLVAIGLVPVLVSWQLQVSLIAPLVNLIAVPVFSLLIIPGALLGALLLLCSEVAGGWLFWLLSWPLEAALGALQWVAELPVAAWDSSGVAPLAWLPAVVGMVLLLSPAGLPGRALGMLLLSPLLLLRPAAPAPGEFWLTLLDVSQGLSAVVRTHSHALVFDAGPRFSEDFDAGSAVVIPFLQQTGIERIDRLVLSNGDSDHAGGGQALYAHYPVGELISGEPERIEWARAMRCTSDMHWQWDGVKFRFLYPAASEPVSGNDASCVLRVEGPHGRILLTGDVEVDAERRLLERSAPWLEVELVQVPHHGSLTSSSPAFVSAVSPEYALVSAGHGNRWGFPRPQVMARWRAAGARLLETAGSGAITFRFGWERSGALRHRELARRYWHDRAD